MILKNKQQKVITAAAASVMIIVLALFLWMTRISPAGEDSLVLIKNSGMSAYGTGFAVGESGFSKGCDTIITAYSVIATPTGAPPKTAEVRQSKTGKTMSANVAFYDVGRNVAILKLPQVMEELKAVTLTENIDFTKSVSTIGYDGTGNIMSDFENFTATDIIKYNGSISNYDEMQSVVVYKFSNEFNRAMTGGPALDEKGRVIGMCGYSLDSMNTYSQYIMSSEELSRILYNNKIDFVTSNEVKYKIITVVSGGLGLLLFVWILLCGILNKNNKISEGNNKNTDNKNQDNENQNNENQTEKNLVGNNKKFTDRYLKITNGVLKGKTYKFDGTLRIGRDPSKCDIVYPIDEPGISSLHCTLQMVEDECYLADNFSKYGTFLENGFRVNSSYPYKIQIEDEKFVFYIGDKENRMEFTF